MNTMNFVPLVQQTREYEVTRALAAGGRSEMLNKKEKQL